MVLELMGKMSRAGVSLSGSGMRDVGNAGAWWVRNYHNHSCMQMWGDGGGGGRRDGAPPLFSQATGRRPLSTFFFPLKPNKADARDRSAGAVKRFRTLIREEEFTINHRAEPGHSKNSEASIGK